ncbi:phosphoesterase RecJ domain-containing protein [Salinarchaeum sp. Harcht-Bsk1]|uniref:DHH family phosphoesterase n=1 Tax=Salinarchaeum sp. Harcht-Bsk1 TaxID=1333523 RepID=UPI00034232B6|nr:DHH family phosphoesterase [Salinarchaeum sp. Harcht-Bsk1]AGN00679.1 phosphoesterase RecJ domain-containing protein [Salinarchaeum sp. Harcht-Bsk1]
MTGPIPALTDRANRAAERLAAADHVLLASHADADGLASAAVGAAALERAGIPHDVQFADQLDEATIQRLASGREDVVFLTDFGSGQLDDVYAHLDPEATIVADHHQPLSPDAVPAGAPATAEYADAPYHVNPLLVGLDGARECSGAGATYAVARAIAERDPPAALGPEHAIQPGSDPDPRNRDLAALAIVGAVGDRQREDGELVGANVAIAAEGEAAGVLTTETDLGAYGTQTKPLPELLAHADEIRVPGVATDRNAAARFLDGLDLKLRTDGEWRRWAELTGEERQTVASGLCQRAIQRGVPAERIDEMVGTAYTLSGEEPATQLRDASEFATLLNATARYERSAVGLAVLLGDRDGALEEATDLLAEHRRNLSRGVRWVEDHGVTIESHCQWFDAGSEIPATIVGIVAGMAVGADGVDPSIPIVAFAEDGDEVKVSARATGGLVRRGVDLSEAMATAASAVDGSGGGHTVAAGATIPPDSTDEFVSVVDDVLATQLQT